MADLLVSSAHAEPVKICPACGDVLVSGVCAACAPPPARAYHERGAPHPLSTPGTKGFVDSRRAAAEWSVSPEELDPHTRKAHPSQLKPARRDYELPEPTPRGKRQTQVYRKGGGPLPAQRGAAPSPARNWSLPEPHPEPTSDTAQASSTARHARPVSPLRAPSGPVSMPASALSPTPAPEQLAPAETSGPTDALARAEAPARAEKAHRAEPAPPVDPIDAPEVLTETSTDADADVDADFDTGLARRSRPSVPPVAWLVLAAGALIGVVAAVL